MLNADTIKKGNEALTNCYYQREENGFGELPAIFHGEPVILLDKDVVGYKSFLLDKAPKNGALLGRGGMKNVYHINGKAVFLINYSGPEGPSQVIDQEVSMSHQLNLLGFKAQTLKKDCISLYHSGDARYYDYLCMSSDSFSTLSVESNCEVFDLKNRYRFGSKQVLYTSDEDCMNNELNHIIFQDILNDLAKLLYFGFQVNLTDSLNVAFMPANDGTGRTTARLFLYDFSSKFYTPDLHPNILNTLPERRDIRDRLHLVIGYVLEADNMARHQRRDIGTPSYIRTFLSSSAYAELEEAFITQIEDKIKALICKKPKFEARTLPALIQSTEMREAYERFSLYRSSTKEEGTRDLKCSNSCDAIVGLAASVV